MKACFLINLAALLLSGCTQGLTYQQEQVDELQGQVTRLRQQMDSLLLSSDLRQLPATSSTKKKKKTTAHINHLLAHSNDELEDFSNESTAHSYTPSVSSYSGYSESSTRSTPGTDVHVNGYYRTSKSGKTTYVHSYTRSAPHRR